MTILPAAGIVAIIGCLLLRPALADDADWYKIKCPLHASDGRVVAVDIHIAAGSIRSVSGLPPEWSMTISNGPSLRSTFEGLTAVGAGALDCSGLARIAIQITKEKADLHFGLEGFLTATVDFERLKRIPLHKNDFESGK